MYKVQNYPRDEQSAVMMHKEKMKPKYDLEDYIYDVESRSLENEPEPDDIYARYQQKEKDLILAAELGKALLEKNEELSRQNERQAEEYSQHLEELEQERHLLRRKLLSTQAECDTKTLELQADIRELQNALDDRENSLKQTEKEKTLLIAELTEQNQRLQMQIKESSKSEEALTLQLQGLRDQCNLKKSSLQDHQSSIEVLREEIQLISEKKIDLEKRLHNIQSDRDGLMVALEEANDRVVMLERQTREQEIQLRVCKKELDELRNVNGSLGNRLEALGSLTNFGHRSLLNEIESESSTLTPADELQHMKKEVASVCERVKIMCLQMKHRARDMIDTSRLDNISVAEHQIKVGMLSCVIQELYDAISSFDAHNDYSNNTISVTELEIDLHRAKEKVDRLTKDLEEKTEEIKRHSESIMDLTSKLSVREAELAGAREERDRARADKQDLQSLAKDEIIKKAWEVRDGAVARKNAVQIELARVRIDLLQANSQLMEVVQQKVHLSQQLEQWQMDMQALLDEQMRRKLTNQDHLNCEAGVSMSADKKRASRLLFGFFQR